MTNRTVSRHPRKQHKTRARAGLHIRQKFLHARLEESLSKRYGRRSAQVKKGDTIKVMRGDFRNHEGKVASVNLKRESIEVDGVTVHKADGSEVAKPLHPSNVMITKLELKDKMRTRKLEGG